MWIIGKKYNVTKSGEQYIGYTYIGCKLVKAMYDDFMEDWMFNCSSRNINNLPCSTNIKDETVECHLFSKDGDNIIINISRDPRIKTGMYDVTETVEKKMFRVSEHDVKCAWERDPHVRRAFITTFNKFARMTQ